MLCAFVFIAFPVSIIGANFSSVWHAHKRRLKVKKKQKYVAQSAVRKYGKGMKLRKIISEISRAHHEIGLKSKSYSNVRFAYRNSPIRDCFHHRETQQSLGTVRINHCCTKRLQTRIS